MYIFFTGADILFSFPSASNGISYHAYGMYGMIVISLTFETHKTNSYILLIRQLYMFRVAKNAVYYTDGSLNMYMKKRHVSYWFAFTKIMFPSGYLPTYRCYIWRFVVVMFQWPFEGYHME